MRTFRKLAALCAVFLLTLCFLPTAAHATETPPPIIPPIEETEQQYEAVEQPEPPIEVADEVEPPIEAPEETESVIPIEDTINIVPPAGTGTVIDIYNDGGGRRFYTIATPAGNIFYLIIDTTRQADNVYFLDAVTERDLIALAEKSGGDVPSNNSVSAIPDTGTDVTPTPEPTPGQQTEPEPEAATGNDNMYNMILVAVVLAIGGGAGWYFKVYRKRNGADIRDEYEADEQDDYSSDDYETEPDDDTVPWEEDE